MLDSLATLLSAKLGINLIFMADKKPVDDDATSVESVQTTEGKVLANDIRALLLANEINSADKISNRHTIAYRYLDQCFDKWGALFCLNALPTKLLTYLKANPKAVAELVNDRNNSSSKMVPPPPQTRQTTPQKPPSISTIARGVTPSPHKLPFTRPSPAKSPQQEELLRKIQAAKEALKRKPDDQPAAALASTSGSSHEVHTAKKSRVDEVAPAPSDGQSDEHASGEKEPRAEDGEGDTVPSIVTSLGPHSLHPTGPSKPPADESDGAQT